MPLLDDEDDNKVAEPGAGFDSRGMGLKIQKKLLGKMSSKSIAKHFIDDTTGKVLDATYKIMKEYASKKDAEKMMKCIIKIVVKVGILYRNDQFNADELAMAESFKKKFHSLAMTVISFHEVEFTYDAGFLKSSIEECRQLLQTLIDRHSTDKTKGRVDHVFQSFCDEKLMDVIFASEGKFHEFMKSIVINLRKMMDEGNL
ncbi:tumor necrosis factor alpha-induced protein 8-like isoform X1 [Pecten maximus]|uniref:tumor necrosis factor alpha-induced protein 8-like isoform X1 n=1 Tax=Pecten maximus TaxID=6579 RepID=UPI001458D453|nr:tumor necrosis factor alpha-induced protein 8-like isoform X1 [Pecten maximus]XP_033750827.1 tumor necrosis factor alpha-induced protein 8-like isoform X1 [Pecten maximus]XP_033750829.1 tumor necrosis factor alpha-induced protein 8-like isoform X1 [Pecten maximus]XP_033750830.1 tumor necrosis factor alpha-induced protein 8-like isoform X1 [Pecten maximus]XP_033750831.1 tumor necrosis factor alpha-induced protein 8-like isoform X1 [Pecten maximus]XP_033750832.1 tumor necrosis factor alpha-in